MNKRATKAKTDVEDGGLPADDGALDAFGAAARGAFEPRRRPRRSATPVNTPSPAGPEPQPRTETPRAPTGVEPAAAQVTFAAPRMPSAAATRDAPAPRRSLPGVATLQVPDLGEAGRHSTQCTIMVRTEIRRRFEHYQGITKLQTGREPTNAVVVRRAVLHARKQNLFTRMLESVRRRQQPVGDEDLDDDGLLGEVPNRRADRGRIKDSDQQSLRPSRQELAVFDAYVEAYSFANRSEFLDAALDEFLPELPANKRTGR
jgi:hypothetical protein